MKISISNVKIARYGFSKNGKYANLRCFVYAPSVTGVNEDNSKNIFINVLFPAQQNITAELVKGQVIDVKGNLCVDFNRKELSIFADVIILGEQELTFSYFNKKQEQNNKNSDTVGDALPF